MQARQMQDNRCRQVTLRALTQPRSNSEVTTVLQKMIASVQFRGELAVITHKGEVLGFVISQIPEALQPLADAASTEAALRQNLTLKALRAWADSGVVKLTYRGRHRVWFIASKYQNRLPLPILSRKR